MLYSNKRPHPGVVADLQPRQGNGRVFYCSPSHFPASFDQPALLQFMLGGIQYVLGDLDCAGFGRLPDAALRKKMLAYFESL